jgi:hypothetical protein
MRANRLQALTIAAAALALLAPAEQAQAQTHVLRYQSPQNVFRSSVGPGENYAFNGTNASVQVYQFRAFNGDIQQAFRRTLLREWIDPMHQEENVAAPPQFQRVAIPGADIAIAASFAENRVGLARPHNRMLIIAGNEAAIVDASAGTLQGWQVAIPALNQMAATMRVEASRGPTPLNAGAGRDIAGLYMGTKPKYMATMYNVTGSGYYQQALHFYLFSADGHVYRAYDKLDVRGGRFDFDAAERNDPMNAGRYTVDGGKLVITLNRDNPETIVTDAPKNGAVTINTITYQRQ